jgi:hypothetical protein
MEDQSHLDKKYFIDEHVYNCPFCNRRNVSYKIKLKFKFDWTKNKECYGVLVECASTSCHGVSLHLSYKDIITYNPGIGYFFDVEDIDSEIFYSRPTSFFVIDNRIHEIVRELITEAEGCLKMNYLTGASACMRKAIYELLVKEEAKGKDYESRIKWLKSKYPDSDPDFFDILSHIQDMTSDKVHEQSWDKWDSPQLKLIIETLKSVLFDIYVIPDQRKERSKKIAQMKEKLKKDKTQEEAEVQEIPREEQTQ